MDDYTNMAKLNSMKLIRLVRQNESLYDSDAVFYNDKTHKDLIWERIHQGLYPDYNALSDAMKETIRANVRRRWKTLRDAIGREVRKTATVENYCRKKGNPILAELEFLIPHIKSAYCAKLADELNLRDSTNSLNEYKFDVEELTEADDLHEMLDMKPFNMSDNPHNSGTINADDDCSIYQSHTALYPLVQMKTNDTIDITTENSLSNGELPDNNRLPEANQNQTTTRSSKRPRSDDNSEFQTKVLQLLTNLERKERNEHRHDQEIVDEDRMFLLSLVSDLKSIPASRKMLVKAEIATAIARAGQP